MPVRAVDIQWMWRGSSPYWYGRRAWKATSPAGDASDVGPSRSLAKPTGRGSSSAQRGWTHSVSAFVCVATRRNSPIGSARVTTAGPTWNTPRRVVGSAYIVECRAPGARAGTSMPTVESPTYSSTRTWRVRRARPLTAVISAMAGSPTVTRSGSSRRCNSMSGAPITNGTAISRARRQPAASTISSIQPSCHPAT